MVRIAIPAMDKHMEAAVAQHFGRAPYIVFVDVENGEIKSTKSVNLPINHMPGEIPGIVKENGGDVIIAYGMGRRARDFFEQYGIEVITGAIGHCIKDVVEAYIKGEIKIDPGWEEKEGFRHHNHGC